MSNSEIIVPNEAENERLDRFLVGELKQARNQVQKLIKDRFVTVNGKVPSVHQWLKEGDDIVIEAKSKIAPLPPSLDIVAETDDYVVLRKPVNVLTHPANGSPFPAITDALLLRYPDIKNVGENGRPGIVHRLDRDVSGLLVVAKTVVMYDDLKGQFRDRLVKKIYTGLVEGKVAEVDGVINFPIARSKTYPGRMAARPNGQEGRPAETRYKVLKTFANSTLLQIELITGRMHQIRVHLKALGHTLVGDTLYGRRKGEASHGKDLGRLFLEATTIGFTDFKDERQEFTIPLDKELEKYLSDLR